MRYKVGSSIFAF